MLKAYINCEILFVLSFINLFVISESNENKNSLIEKHVSKRNDPDFQTCLESFDIYQDKIIRTQDSRDMGAKYLNERDVLSRDDCLKLCCETDNCDVFVFEEKSPGGCYLFECGSSEDFKCKFTKHQNYTSAVLKINRHLTELETQIKFTQHEHELTKLRQPPVNSNPITIHFPTTESTKNQETINFGIERPPNEPTITKSRECSRYQFECHTSKECIAIYNACDGIPQCSDGSDEAPELGCPATPTPSPLVTTSNPSKPLPKTEQDVEVHKVDPGIKVTSESQKQYPQQPYTGDTAATGNSYATNPLQSNMNLPSNVPNSRTGYGREGEGMTNFHPEQQWAYQYHPNQGGSQIFTHKGNGLVPQADRYPQHQYIQQEIPQRGMIQQYGEQIPNDYAKYYYDNVPYRILPQNQPVNNWQMPHKNQEVVNQGLDDSPLNRLENLPVGNGPGQDYYYEEAYRNRPQSPQGYGQRAPMSQNVHPRNENKVPETVMETNGNDMTAKHDVPKKKPPIVHTVETTTTKPKEETPAHVSHRKVEKVSAELKMKESLIEDDMDGHSTSPSGAVLSLTMGLCITGLMLIFVGCRMRVVKRRMRRGGKSPYAHDADFLVNGMYL
ncbi:uncharacterized protein [Halyomorpha halys]|uniref:uncharacterized protein n=1 Tax=Halyomorpha halys TaxID=286706 RepID=UPI0006D4F817|nr:uncharacterized protein LOC106684186 [Halyomorpha halys]